MLVLHFCIIAKPTKMHIYIYIASNLTCLKMNEVITSYGKIPVIIRAIKLYTITNLERKSTRYNIDSGLNGHKS